MNLPEIQNERIEEKQTKLQDLKKRYNEKESIPIEEYTMALFDKIHEYNKFKDVGQKLLGILAERAQVTVKDMYKQFDMEETD